MSLNSFDIVLLTQKEYVNPEAINEYIQNVLTEDELLTRALEEKGLRVARTHWDDETFDWENTPFALFRATWDYFNRFAEFHRWLNKRSQQIQLINSHATILWSMDKHYLRDLQMQGINIPPTLFIEKNCRTSLTKLMNQVSWKRAILKPAISGAARHTYLVEASSLEDQEAIFQELIGSEAMLLQEYQEQITTKGEVSFMVFDGQFSHAVLKKAKAGVFRVQDDFGGTLHPYSASQEEKDFVEQVIAHCKELPVYARVDVMWDNQDRLCLSELELIEPELWFRKEEKAAAALANAVHRRCCR